ncbi:MAG: AI-2E family transporter, partial [Chitinophagaceae bacterium]
MNNVIDQNRLRQTFFIILILLMGVVLFIELYSFLPALLGAVTLYILMRRWMFYLAEKKKWKKGLAALLLMLISLIAILVPVGMLVNMLSGKVTYAVEHSTELVGALKKVASDFEQRFDIVILSDANINKLGTSLTQALPKILGATFNTLAAVFFMYFILYFMFVSGRQMERVVYEYIPLKDDNVTKLEK